MLAEITRFTVLCFTCRVIFPKMKMPDFMQPTLHDIFQEFRDIYHKYCFKIEASF